ncbi:hypothetical protein G6F57_006310 [Rhizopus arrhizus]|nr:hypothetical protein G6F23_002244 [Rhizopus arrhizus]KAG1424146.1 hypothetical protein G6F58_002515 [Rhizopus delemar]KAG0767173.1 hypothetical protein G6F24_003006 [Rhizopus arrhizus]KAG0781244.1 hypothetical protein G6F22_009670 [Rhizopus arrhizus]KAG0794357.1 hypothetical protein G6F21_002923 [Rhizopus arrhizus]
MVLSAKNHAQHLNPANAGKRATPKTTWRKIVTRDIVSLKHSTPTSATVPPTLSRRNSSLSSTSDFNKKNSILVEVTDIQEPTMLRRAFQDFNDDEVQQDYLGRSTITRKYLNRTYIETRWMVDSVDYNSILAGITLPDNTIVKDYKSLPAEAQIHRLSSFENVLDLGTIRSDGCLTGVGYVTLDIKPAANKGKHLQALQRIIQWDDGDGEIRQVYI